MTISETSPAPLLEVKDLSTHFFTGSGVLKAVNGVSFSLNRGERMAVVGESGSGKSVMTMSLIRLIPYPGRIVSGEVLFDGEDVLQFSDHELRSLRGGKAGVVFQDPMTSLNPVMRVQDQLIPPMQRHLHMSREDAKARAIELLRQVGIPSPEERVRAYPHELSGGMRQRVLIAMALSCKPDLILADEPTTALDVTTQAQIVELLKDLSASLGTAVIFVTHDLGLVARFAHKVAIMYSGRIVEKGPVNDIFANPQHPYTQGLLSSIPTVTGDKSARLAQIPGVPPDMRALGDGCSFAPRCPMAQGRCAIERPALTSRGLNHDAACWVTDPSPAAARSLAEAVHA